MIATATDLPMMISARQVAGLMNVSMPFFERAKAAGRVPKHVALSKTLHRWNRDEVLAWIEAGLPDRKTWEETKRRK